MLESKAWAKAYNLEFIGFKEQGVFSVVKQQPGIRVLDMLTRLEYKEDNCKFIKCKACLYAREDRQVYEVHYKETNLCAHTLKAAEGRLMMAIAAANQHKFYKTDTKQAYLYCDMGKHVVYLRPPDWCQEPIPEGHVQLLVKSIYGSSMVLKRGKEVTYPYFRLDDLPPSVISIKYFCINSFLSSSHEEMFIILSSNGP